MDTEVVEPAAPAAPDAPQPASADDPEPMDAEQPTAAEVQEQPAPEAADEKPAVDDSAAAAPDASEPAPSPSKQKQQAKQKAAPNTKEKDMPVITPGSRERKKVEHFKPEDAPAERKPVAVQEVRRLSRLGWTHDDAGKYAALLSRIHCLLACLDGGAGRMVPFVRQAPLLIRSCVDCRAKARSCGTFPMV